LPKIERRTFIKRTAAGGIALLGGITRAPHGPNAARAQGTTEAAWPNRPVRFIVPLAPGGGLDFVARVVGEPVSRAIGQQIVIENRTGAGGTIGIETAIKSPPDGYSVLVTNDNVASAPHILKLDIDYLNELVPVIQLARQPLALAAHPSLAASSVAELIERAKQQPGLGCATSRASRAPIPKNMRVSRASSTSRRTRSADALVSRRQGGKLRLGGRPGAVIARERRAASCAQATSAGISSSTVSSSLGQQVSSPPAWRRSLPVPKP
jgi:hypothetical protein